MWTYCILLHPCGNLIRTDIGLKKLLAIIFLNYNKRSLIFLQAKVLLDKTYHVQEIISNNHNITYHNEDKDKKMFRALTSKAPWLASRSPIKKLIFFPLYFSAVSYNLDLKASKFSPLKFKNNKAYGMKIVISYHHIKSEIWDDKSLKMQV